jgi:hypothetical protein
MGGIVSSIFGGGGGGGGGAPAQTTSTSYNTNIPEYAKHYVENMLGATQKQLFTMDGNTITGFKPYQPYSYNPEDYVAGFSPLQQQAQQGVGNLRASPAYDIGTMGSLGVAGQANPYGFQSQVGGYMNPYLQQVLNPQMAEANRAFDVSGANARAEATKAGAFGGGRQAIMAAENERNRNMALNGIVGQGYNTAFNQAQQQYNQNLQNQLAGYGSAANIANQGLQAEQGILNMQNTVGAQQQSRQQQIINQQIQDYANAQQDPLMKLGTMSNMLRGLPMQAQTTNQYQAAPNQLTQAIGAAGTAASLYNATKGASGGLPEEFKYASGGITSIPRYDVGGAIKAKLEDMDVAGLQREAKESSSPQVRQMAQEILATKQMAQAPGKAGGGIIAFAQPTKENNQSLVEDKEYPDTDVSLRDTLPKTTTPLTRAGQAVRNALAVKTPEKMRFEEIDESLIPKKDVAPAVADKGITAVPTNEPRVAPQAVAQTAPQAAAAPAGGTAQGIPGAPRPNSPEAMMAPLLKEYERLTKEAKQDEGALANRLKEEAGPNVGRENYRAQEMARRANLADEAYREKQMRLAEFFAEWGSTPGSTLSAGMSAVRKKIPAFVDDARAAKKLQREADKIIYDLDEATRLEESGYRKEARTIIQQAAVNASHLNSAISSFAGHALTAKSHENVAAAQREATAAGKAQAADERKITSRLHAQQNTISLLKAHEAERKEPEYVNASNMLKMGKDENGNDIPLDKLPKERRPLVAAARETVYEVANRHKQERDDARKLEESLQERTSLGKGNATPGPDRSKMTPIESFYKKP